MSFLEVAHFFHADAPYHCDIHHLPLPSKNFYVQNDAKNDSKVRDHSSHREYSLFKKGIMPVWEDPKNATGGCWYARQYLEPELLDHYWQNLVQGIVDETIEDDDKKTCMTHINGIRIDDKSGKHPVYKIEIWLDTEDKSIRDKIRHRVVKYMTDGKPKKEHHIKMHWKSFSGKVHSSDDESANVSNAAAAESAMKDLSLEGKKSLPAVEVQ
jgi:hypothetical protein